MFKNILLLILVILAFSFIANAEETFVVKNYDDSKTEERYFMVVLGSFEFETDSNSNYEAGEVLAKSTLKTKIEGILAHGPYVTCDTLTYSTDEQGDNFVMVNYTYAVSGETKAEVDLRATYNAAIDNYSGGITFDEHKREFYFYHHLPKDAGVVETAHSSSASTFTVPAGVYRIRIQVQAAGGTYHSSMHNVQPADIINIDTSYEDADKNTFEYYFRHGLAANSDMLVSMDGSTANYASGATNLLSTGSLAGGEGWTISYYDECPAGFTDIHSDFSPVLLYTSSLYILNDVSTLQINFKVPFYYTNIFATYGDKCTENVTQQAIPSGCMTEIQTYIDHQGDCSFDLEVDTDATRYVYKGTLEISADLVLDIDGYAITRKVISPLSWKVYLDRQISVSTELKVNLTESAICYTKAECTDGNGCCENGECNCDCTELSNGYAGKYCQNDIEAPTCLQGCESYSFDSKSGGDFDSWGRGLMDNIVFGDNSNDHNATENSPNLNLTILSIAVTTIKGGVVNSVTYGGDYDHTKINFQVNYKTTVTFNVTDASGNTALLSYDVTINDYAAVHYDCHNCQEDWYTIGDNSPIILCVGDATGWTKQTAANSSVWGDMAGDKEARKKYESIGQHYFTVLAGTRLPEAIDFSFDGYGLQYNLSGVDVYKTDKSGFLDCECNFIDGELGYDYNDTNSDRYLVTNDENVITDFTSNTAFYPRMLDSSTTGSSSWASTDKTVNFFGSVIDNGDSNSVDFHWSTKACVQQNVVYDIVKPICQDNGSRYKNYTILADETNPNYTLPLPEQFNIDLFADTISDDLSGINGSSWTDVLDLENSTLRIGKKLTKQFVWQYAITDYAGNTEICKVVLDATGSVCVNQTNPDQTDWSKCNDVPPVNHYCPDDMIYDCHENGNSGTGSFITPNFTDDKFVKSITVEIRGVDSAGVGTSAWKLIETYNNDQVSNSTNYKLDTVGYWEYRYFAVDKHYVKDDADFGDHYAECKFKVQYKDDVSPIFNGTQSNGCPVDVNHTTTLSYYEYSETISFEDECIFNTGIYKHVSNNDIDASSEDFPHRASFSIHQNLTIGVNSFSHTFKDYNDNPVTCSWDVNVFDDGFPVISCPSNETERAPQSNTPDAGIVMTYNAATATDSSGVVPTITYTQASNTVFNIGTTIVTATATDAAGNEDSCNFTITVLPPYEYLSFDVALIQAHVRFDNPNFKADLRLVTVVNVDHRVSKITADSEALVDAVEISADCGKTDPVCIQYWDFTASFSEACNMTDEKYDLVGHTYCTPDDCNENKTQPIEVELSAANYCWQDLESVDVSAELTMMLDSDKDAYLVMYTGVAPVSIPSSFIKTAFENDDVIAGIVTVTSDQVQLKSVSMQSASRYHFEEDRKTLAVDDVITDNPLTISVLTDASHKKKHLAIFTYTEDQVPLETTLYTRYDATVEVEYDFGTPTTTAPPNTGARRMLLQANSDKSSKQVSAETISFSKLEKEDNQINDPSDIKTVLKLTNCNGDNLEVGLENVISSYLRIETERVNVLVSTSTCLVQVTIKQSECDLVSVIELLDSFETAITDPFNNIHTAIYYNNDIPMDVTVDYNVFFVSQQPSQIESSSLSSNSNNSITSNDNWMMYSLTGVAIGAIISGLFISYNKK